MPAKRGLDPAASPLHFFDAEGTPGPGGRGDDLGRLSAAVPCDASTMSTANPAR
jgi:hypothetical protein